MTPQSFSIRCHRCNQWLGESRCEMEVVGMFRDPRAVEMVSGPRDTWKCKCGWATVFQPSSTAPPPRSWRKIELKETG